ncbi:MAG: DUF6516 family protein [Deltaproteobacteria bacterium]
MTSSRTSAFLIYHSKVSLIHKVTEEVAIAELRVRQVPKSKDFPDGIKYSLFLVMKETGKTIIGIDNHKPKGHHLHIGDKEETYHYVGVDELIEDFWKKVEKEGFLI